MVYMVSATVHYPDDKYNEFATCVAEVINTIFGPKKVLFVLFPIMFQSSVYTDDKFFRLVNVTSKDNSHCSTGTFPAFSSTKITVRYIKVINQLLELKRFRTLFSQNYTSFK